MADADVPSIEDEMASDEDMIGDENDDEDDEDARDRAYDPDGPRPASDMGSVDDFMEDGVSEEDYETYAALDEIEEIDEDTGDALHPEDEDPDAGSPEGPVSPAQARRAASRGGEGRRAGRAGPSDTRTGPRRGRKAALVEAAVSADPIAGGDDLKQIKGVGPKMESKLKSLGITTFAQIADWTADDIASFEGQLRFQGRVERDRWIEQARTLASGGDTAFSTRVKKGDVYE